MSRVEHVPVDAIWQERVSMYDCPTCRRPVFSQSEATDPPPSITCLVSSVGHILRWETPEAEPEPASPDEPPAAA